MTDFFNNEDYKENMSILIKNIETGNTTEANKQYTKTLNELSQSLKSFTNKEQSVAEFIIRGDLTSHMELKSKKPLGLVKKLQRILGKILGIKYLKKNDKINDFIVENLPPTTSDSGYESLSDEENIYEEISSHQEKEGKSYSQDSKNYATISREHTEAKRSANKSKPIIPPKPPRAPLVPKKTLDAYINPDAPKINWETYPVNRAEVMKVNNVPPTPQPRKQRQEEPIYVNISSNSSKTNQKSETEPPKPHARNTLPSSLKAASVEQIQTEKKPEK